MKQTWTCDCCGISLTDEKIAATHEKECLAAREAAYKIKELFTEACNIMRQHNIKTFTLNTNSDYGEDEKKRFTFKTMYPTLRFTYDPKSRNITNIKAEGTR